MALDDAPILPQQTSISGGEFIPLVNASGRELPCRTRDLLGVMALDVTTVSGTTATIATRVTVCTSTSAVTLTLPAASGNLRQVYVLKASATSAVTVNRAGSDPIVSGTSVAATSITVNAGLAALLLSDGTTWYHVSNDA